MVKKSDQLEGSAKLSARISELMARATKAFQSGNASRGRSLQSEAQRLMGDFSGLSVGPTGSRLARPARAADRVVAKMSVRERTISALTELDVPRSPREVAEYAQARTGEDFDARALASIRRDERRSWQSRKQRDAYLVPTLEGQWFLPAHGRLALSFWPLAKRISGPLSPRANHLKVCLSIVSLLEGLLESRSGQASSKPSRARTSGLQALLAEYARSVPGAQRDAWAGAKGLDLSQVREAACREFALIGPDDEEWRQHEAERAARFLDDEQLLWGGEMPQTVSSGLPG